MWPFPDKKSQSQYPTTFVLPQGFEIVSGIEVPFSSLPDGAFFAFLGPNVANEVSGVMEGYLVHLIEPGKKRSSTLQHPLRAMTGVDVYCHPNTMVVEIKPL